MTCITPFPGAQETTYRNQYGEYIDTNGLDALIESIEQKVMENH